MRVWYVGLMLPTVYLSNGDSQDEPGWGTVGVAVKVPLAVDLAGQRLVGDVSDKPLGQPQAHFISETAAFELPAPLQDGPPETVGALVTHLERGGRRRGQRWRGLKGRRREETEEWTVREQRGKEGGVRDRSDSFTALLSRVQWDSTCMTNLDTHTKNPHRASFPSLSGTSHRLTVISRKLTITCQTLTPPLTRASILKPNDLCYEDLCFGPIRKTSDHNVTDSWPYNRSKTQVHTNTHTPIPPFPAH